MSVRRSPLKSAAPTIFQFVSARAVIGVLPA
jgi:hypothetical protein